MIVSTVTPTFLYKGLTRNLGSEIPPSEFCPISEDWDKLGILNLAQISLMKCYCMLKNTSAWQK